VNPWVQLDLLCQGGQTDLDVHQHHAHPLVQMDHPVLRTRVNLLYQGYLKI
jgi:hypothetical protein